MTPRPWLSAYDTGVPTAIAFEDITVPQMLERAAAQHADRPAILYMNRRISYADLKDQVDRLATALAALGVTRDGCVAIQLPNIPQTVIAWHAVARLGAKIVLTNPLYTPREMEHQWKDAGCTVAVVGDWNYDQKIRPNRDRFPVRDYIVATIAEYLRFPLRQLAPFKLKRASPPMTATVAFGPGVHSFLDLATRTPAAPPAVALGLDDVAVLQYTGGTTGVSKGAMLTHRNLSCNVQQTVAWFPGLEPGREVMLACLPIFHVFGMTVGMNFPIRIGGAIALVLNPRDVGSVITTLEHDKVTIAPMVPALFNSIGQTKGIEKRDLSSVRYSFSGSAPLSVDVQRRFERLTGGKICEGFGLTEASPVTHVNPIYGKRKLGTIGVPIAETDAKIVDLDTGQEQPPGEPGELVIKGPQVMKGYWNQPEETARALRDGWLHTGDLASVDADGFFTIVGRTKEMIAASGFKVYPDEVDRVLMSHPAVLEATTIGVPDEKRGESVKSFVVLRPGEQVSAETLTAFCRENLAPYKVPKTFEFRSELPKTAMMKILRRVLVAEELAKARKA